MQALKTVPIGHFIQEIKDRKEFIMKKTISDYPELISEWDFEKNEVLDPKEVSYGSNKYAWWICENCGNSWRAKISNRTILNRGCPKCGKLLSAEKHRIVAARKNNLAKRFPELAAEWHPYKNGELKPEGLSCSNDIVAWWICSVCGSEYKMAIKHRTGRRDGCPVCNKKGTSFPEQAVYFYLSKVYPDAQSRYNFNGIELDVFIPSINCAIEYDGKTWHSDLKKDNKKDEYCYTHGIKLFRIRDFGLPKTSHAVCFICYDNKESLGLAIRQVLLKIKGNCLIDIDISRDELAIKALLKRYIKNNSLAAKCPELATEFAKDLNNGLTANNLSWSSSTSVWWRCGKCGYVWKSSPNKRNRTKKGTGCPRCAISITSQKNRVEVVNLDTKEVFKSLSDAAKSCNGNKSDICSCCKGKKKTALGFRWAYLNPNAVKRRNYYGRIINVDTQEIFDSPNEAARSCNGDRRNIVQCCYGKTKTSYGFHWAFFKDSE